MNAWQARNGGPAKLRRIRASDERVASEELDGLIHFGARPRATLFLVRGAQAQALIEGRPYELPEDVKNVAPDILRHRIHVSYEAEAEGVNGEEVARRILEQVRVP